MLFRAVERVEAEDIERLRIFRNPPGIEVKYFFVDRRDAEWYASRLRQYGANTRLVGSAIEIPLPNGVDELLGDGGRRMIVIPSDLLPNLPNPVFL